MSKLPDTFQHVWASLRTESTRGCVIVACAIIEDKLELILKKRLVKCDDKTDYLFSGGNPPLGTISAKIDLAFRTGCISQNVHKGLHIIRKLRNDFAHLSREICFETESVKSRTDILFDLNREIIELMWGNVRGDLYSFAGVNIPPLRTNLFDEMKANVSYRSIFELLASILAGHLTDLADEIEQLQKES